MNKIGLTLVVLSVSAQGGTSSAPVVTERCEQRIENIYPLLPDLSPTSSHEPVDVRGAANLTNIAHSDEIKDVAIRYPAGSYDPASMVHLGLPYGGITFKAPLPPPGRECLILTYDVKFDKNFDFVKGGKLPGLYGGNGNTGGNIPNGHDGFSTRYIWKEEGAGAVYAYLPNSQLWGTALGLGSWTFTVDRWHTLEQLVKLNDPGQANGVISVWYDGILVHAETGVIFRDTQALKIDGLLFSTFFGGNNETFATPVSTHIRFRNMVMSSQRIVDALGRRRAGD